MPGHELPPEPFHRWRRIIDVTDYSPLPRRTDMDEAAARWRAQKQQLNAPERLAEFEEQLRNEWAIETGQIERLYMFTRGTTQALIRAGFERVSAFSSADRTTSDTVDILKDQKDALEFTFSFVRDERELSISFVQELHQLLCRHQDTYDAIDPFGRRFKRTLEKGKWKQLPNSPERPDGRIHEYCPPEHVAQEMDRLVAFHQQHRDLGLPPELQSAWLHLAFTQIHPFQDGNGRVARALATLVFLKADMLPLVIRDAQREAYIGALEAGDGGRLGDLVNLFADTQIADLNRAVVFAGGTVREDIESIAAAAAARERAIAGDSVPERLKPVIGAVFRQLRSVADRLEAGFIGGDVQLVTNVRAGGGLGYSAGSERTAYWVRLDLGFIRPPSTSIEPDASVRVTLESTGSWSEYRVHVDLRQFEVDSNGPTRFGSVDFGPLITAETVRNLETSLEPMLGAALRDWAAGR